MEYLAAYDRRISRLFPERATFFPNREDHPYSASWLEQNFLRFWYAAFPEKKDSGISIRAYDFRHHFVYANMNRWLREGKDVNAMLPYLMRYMGHSDVKIPCTTSISCRISMEGYWEDSGTRKG